MDRSDMETRANALRQELKVWEKSFASQHDGRKAGREDIKANAAISLKYKEYTKLRDVLSGRTAPQTPSKCTATRRLASDTDRTPKARPKSLNTTPLKRKRDDSGVKFGDEDAEKNIPAELLSPEGPEMIGPTPQRDGIVLGLFDVLPFAVTPSKRRAVMADVTTNILQTPSKHSAKAESEISVDFGFRGERTPQSVGKRFMLDKFVTPQKRRMGEAATPTSALKGFATPSFLRRDTTLDAVHEDEEPTPRPAPWKRRGLGRSLSTMIQSLKKQEEDRLDEEAEIMREMEMEAQGIFEPRKSRTTHVLVEDSQAPMPLGPDRGEDSEDDEDSTIPEDALDRDGNPRKVWKKKGLKRQTRRVIMRPNFVKPLPLPTTQNQDDDSEKEDAVAETQLALEHNLSDFDDDESDYASDDSHTPKKRRTEKRPETVVKPLEADKTSKSGVVVKAARKIKATAHANYRRLKIKSSTGAKGKGGGRFGRRR